MQYGWNDLNGDLFATPDEVDLAGGQTAAPVNAELFAVNRIDPNYTAAHDTEFTLGFEHELLPNLSVGMVGTWRRSSDLPWAPFLGINNTDYAALPPRERNGFTGQPVRLRRCQPGGGRGQQFRPATTCTVCLQWVRSSPPTA